jgi:hypothetical protein
MVLLNEVRLKMPQIKTTNWTRFRFLRVVTLPICAISPNLLAIILVPVLSADSAPWALLDVRQTGYNQNLAAVSPTGPVYLTNQPCPAPTIPLGDPSFSASCVTKTDDSGQMRFAVQIGGAFAPELVLDSTGNVYITGDAGRGFATTPGVYEPSPPDPTDPFVCKLDGADGHALFCTFIGCDELWPRHLPY